MEEVPSPCVKICRHDANGVCFGCRRTREEIGDWGTYTNEQKEAVIDKTYTRTNVDEEPSGFSF